MFPGEKIEECNLNIKRILFFNKALLFSVVLIFILFNFNFLNMLLKIIIFVFVFVVDFILINYFLSKKVDSYKKKINKHFELLKSEITDINRESSEIIASKTLSEFKGKTEEFKKRIKKTVVELITLLNEVETKLSKQQSSVKDINNSKEILDSGFHGLKDILEEIGKKVVMAYNVSHNISNSANEAFNLSEKIKTGTKLVSDSLKQALDYSNVLYEQSKNINNIIKVIADISSKTHILSINASIVSARAGIHGKAFEVVSKEIRNLATDTEKSSKKIEEEIHNIQETIKLAVDTIRMASDQNSIERESLISVVGSLQGVMLGVEVIRTVSDEAKQKTNTRGINFPDIFNVLGKVEVNIRLFSDMQEELKNEIITASKELEEIGEISDK